MTRQRLTVAYARSQLGKAILGAVLVVALLLLFGCAR